MVTHVRQETQRPVYTMAVLDGSEKQRTWASDIRQKKIRQIAALNLGESIPDIQYRVSYLLLIPSSSWWIIRRGKTPYALLSELTLHPVHLKRLPCTTPQEVLYWANFLFNTVIIDTETTGLYGDVEIVEIAVIDLQGKVLLNTLVHPQNPIPQEATNIHGITDEMVAEAPTFSQVWPSLRALLSLYRVVIYNAKYDMRVIRNLAQRELLPCPPILADCAMLAYSSYQQFPNESGYDGYKWHKLEEVARDLDIDIQGNAHRALSDCLTTLGIVNRLKDIHAREENEGYEGAEW